MVSGTKESNAFNELNRRACDAERTRDEAVIKLHSLEHQLSRSRLT